VALPYSQNDPQPPRRRGLRSLVPPAVVQGEYCIAGGKGRCTGERVLPEQSEFRILARLQVTGEPRPTATRATQHVDPVEAEILSSRSDAPVFDVTDCVDATS